MTYYATQVFAIRDQIFPAAYQVRQIVRAKQFIDNNLTETINLETVAQAASLSKFHFLRLFKRCYGRTPHQYRTEQRLIRAKQLLQTGLSTTEVCHVLNFDSTTSFIGLFKKYTGHTPLAYQRKKQFSRV
ncbi:helix-turn-helix domain-containing protein [Spirosoma gilvum]